LLKVQKELQGTTLTVRLSGDINEHARFEDILSTEELTRNPPTGLLVLAREVRRINSTGVKNWIKYFQIAGSRVTKIRLAECSIALVEQINQIVNFTCGAEVESIFVPFACKGCKSELVGLFTCEDLKRRNLVPPVLKCSKCGGEAVFDDIEDEYFAFLKR